MDDNNVCEYIHNFQAYQYNHETYKHYNITTQYYVVYVIPRNITMITYLYV